jgi:tricorn protease
MKRCLFLAQVILFAALATASAQESRLLRNPAIGESQIAFVYADDIWITGLEGGEARRLTTFPGAETRPHFSPDGKMVAFSGQYDGNTDVYVVAVAGGEPRRLTWHPVPDAVRGWTVDGTSVVFASGRTSAPRPNDKLFTVSLEGGMPAPLPIPRVADGHYSPDGKRFVYQKVEPWETEWRNYRGGQNNPIRIIDLKSYDVEKLPWDGSHDMDPVWIGGTIFFLSDRDYAMNVWSYDLETEKLQQRTHFKDFDCKSLEGGSGRVIFENGGYLYVLDADDAASQPRKLSITVRGDFPWARPHWENVRERITNFTLSPSGKRALFSARGDVFSVPAKKGDIRNLTRSSGVADRAPAWSPDGAHVSWFSDRSREYKLVIADQYGRDQRSIAIKNPTFFYTPRWSPDSKHVAFGDADRNLWTVEVESGEVKLIDNEEFAHPERIIYPEWSPDSKWIAYTKRLENEYSAVFVYSLEKGKSFQITHGMSDSRAPAWDKSGKYIYFLASTDYGLNVGWLDMSSIQRPLNRAVYLVVLAADVPSPLLPESDEESTGSEDEGEKGKKDGKESKENGEEEKSVEVRIDLPGIDQRILALDLPERDYGDLEAGKEGVFFYLEQVPNEDGRRLHRYKLEDRESTEVLSGVAAYAVSADGEKLLYDAGENQWAIVDAGGSPKAGEGSLDLSDMQMKVDPPAEWKQMFREAWRYQRDYFYVENVHGLDLDWAYRTYSPWVDYVRHRADLTYVLDILGGETSIGHSFTGGGDLPDVEVVPVGLLGADLEPEGGRYQIVKIYTGENWNPELRAPLSGPGIDVAEGDYLLAVNGVELDASMNPFALFDRTAGKQTVLTLNKDTKMKGAREVTVVPVASEVALRQRDWVEGNRRKVDELSGGKLAYVWLPNTSNAGYASFNRYYFAQKDKKGAVIDERFNHGGYIADYIVDLLSRHLFGFFNNPTGNHQPWTAPNAAIWGPKVMVINEMSGSGGDMLPFMFRHKGIGPLVGTRTWGGLVGIWDVPPLIDGGYITAPRGGFYNLQGQWDVENKGIAPDVEVEQVPKLVNSGHDPQLEAAVEAALELLKTQGVEILPQPPDPVRTKRPGK